MVNKVFLFGMLFVIVTTNLNAGSNYFNKLKLTTNLQKGEQLVVVFQDIGSCIKCYLGPMQKIENLAKAGKIKNFRLIALVRCSRAIELNIFKSQFDWKNYLFMDYGNSRKKLGANENAKVLVLNYFGKILIEF